MKKITFLFLLGMAQISWSQTINETTLPLEFNTGNPAPYGMPSTAIEIEGKSIPILFDTGAKNTELALTQHALKNIHAKFTGKIQCFNAFDGKHCQKEFIIPEVKLGDFIVKNVKGILIKNLWDSQHNNNFQETEASRDGVMGYALLSKFNILLDYPQAKTILTKPHHQPEQYNLTNWHAIPFTDHVQTKLNLDGRILNFTWDTGAIPSKVNRKLAQKFPQINCPKNNPYKDDSETCLRVETSLITENNGSFKTWFSVEDFPATAPFDGLIGSNFYAENRVYFDFDNHKIYIDKK